MADHIRKYQDDDHARESRSRSPRKHHSHSHRTRSPRRHHQRRKHAHGSSPAIELPYNSRPLTKKDYSTFKPMFALYLDIQKGKILEDMDDIEAQGRWKSYIGKWNRGELAEGWYDPTTLQKALHPAQTLEYEPEIRKQKPKYDGAEGGVSEEAPKDDQNEGESDSDSSIGPTLPGQESRSKSSRVGPRIPNMQDLELKREMEVEDSLAYQEDIRFARKLDRKEQKAALDELVPRAEAGTRERQIEKKKEINEKMKSFREKSPGATEVPDSELMGEGEGIEGFKKQKQEFERKKNERELRKEEMLRARVAEREERLQEYRTKEDSTMAMLKALAKQRFG